MTRKTTKFFAVLLLFVAIFIGCDSDNEVPREGDLNMHHVHDIEVNRVGKADIPEIIDYLESSTNGTFTISLKNGVDGIRNSDTIVLATIYTDTIVMVTDEYNMSNYTFNADEDTPSTEPSVINVIISELDNGAIYSYIVQYLPESNWYNANQGFFDLSTYSGEIIYYNEEGLFVSMVTVYDGVVITTETRDPCDPTGGGGGSSGGGTGGGSGGTGGGTGGSSGGTGGGTGGGSGGTGGTSVVCSCEGHQWGDPDCICATWIITYYTDSFIDPVAMTYLQKGPCGGVGVDPCERSNGDPCGNGAIGIFDNIDPINISIEENIVTTLLDPCSKGVFDNIKNLTQNDFASILQRFGTPFTIYNWEIRTFTPFINPSLVAETDWKRFNDTAIPFEYRTHINPDYVASATEISIARTILHELIHSYLLSLVDDAEILGSNNLTSFPILWQSLVNKTYGNNPNQTQHMVIGRKFIIPLKAALMEWDGAAQSDQYYEDLAWGALENTSTFNAVFPIGADRTRIINTNKAEDTNSTQGGITPNGSSC